MNIIEKIKQTLKKLIGGGQDTSKEQTPSDYGKSTNKVKKIVARSGVDAETAEKRRAEERRGA